MLSNSNRCNCQIGTGIPIGSNWAIIDAGMTERFSMAVTWEMDRAGAFVGGSVYHSCLGTGGDTVRKHKTWCDFNNYTHSHKYMWEQMCIAASLGCFSTKGSLCVSGNYAIWCLTLPAFILCVMLLQPTTKEWLWYLHLSWLTSVSQERRVPQEPADACTIVTVHSVTVSFCFGEQ